MSLKPQSVMLSTRSLKTCLTIVQVTLRIEQREHLTVLSLLRQLAHERTESLRCVYALWHSQNALMILNTFKLCVLHFIGKTKLFRSLLKAGQDSVATQKNRIKISYRLAFFLNHSTISPFVLHLPSAIPPFDSPSKY